MMYFQRFERFDSNWNKGLDFKRNIGSLYGVVLGYIVVRFDVVILLRKKV